MIAVLSSSSPWASVALFSGSELKSERFRESHRRASGTLLEMLDECLVEASADLDSIEVWCADVGPGSFAGTRVGVTLAKTLAFASGKRCAAVSSFDLIGPGNAAVPYRAGSAFLRANGQIAISETLPDGCAGYGPMLPDQTFPRASRCPVQTLTLVPPEELLPAYGADPSISTPNKPYRQVQP